MVNNLSMWLDCPQLQLFVIRGKLKAGCYLFKAVDLWEGSWLYIGFFYIDFFDCVKYLSGSVFFNSLSKDRVILGGGLAFLYCVEMDMWISCIETVEWRNKCKEDRRMKLRIWENQICVNCRVKNYMKVDHRIYRRNLFSYEKKAWKKNRKRVLVLRV